MVTAGGESSDEDVDNINPNAPARVQSLASAASDPVVVIPPNTEMGISPEPEIEIICSDQVDQKDSLLHHSSLAAQTIIAATENEQRKKRNEIQKLMAAAKGPTSWYSTFQYESERRPWWMPIDPFDHELDLGNQLRTPSVDVTNFDRYLPKSAVSTKSALVKRQMYHKQQQQRISSGYINAELVNTVAAMEDTLPDEDEEDDDIRELGVGGVSTMTPMGPSVTSFETLKPGRSPSDSSDDYHHKMKGIDITMLGRQGSNSSMRDVIGIGTTPGGPMSTQLTKANSSRGVNKSENLVLHNQLLIDFNVVIRKLMLYSAVWFVFCGLILITSTGFGFYEWKGYVLNVFLISLLGIGVGVSYRSETQVSEWSFTLRLKYLSYYALLCWFTLGMAFVVAIIYVALFPIKYELFCMENGCDRGAVSVLFVTMTAVMSLLVYFAILLMYMDVVSRSVIVCGRFYDLWAETRGIELFIHKLSYRFEYVFTLFFVDHF